MNLILFCLFYIADCKFVIFIFGFFNLISYNNIFNMIFYLSYTLHLHHYLTINIMGEKRIKKETKKPKQVKPKVIAAQPSTKGEEKKKKSY